MPLNDLLEEAQRWWIVDRDASRAGRYPGLTPEMLAKQEAFLEALDELSLQAGNDSEQIRAPLLLYCLKHRKKNAGAGPGRNGAVRK